MIVKIASYIFSVMKADKTNLPLVACLKVGKLAAVIQLFGHVAGPGGERAQPHCITGASRDGNADPPARKPLSGRKSKGLGEEGTYNHFTSCST